MPDNKTPAGKNIEYIALDQLRFDPLNPRFPKTVDASNARTVLDWMLKDATIVELMGAIGEKGYFPGEPLLVAKTKQGGVYDVVEGNRRLAALKLLTNPELATFHSKSVKAMAEAARERPFAIPALVYDSRDEILDYLGYRHITGVKDWGPLEKARYLKQRFDAEKTGTRDERMRHVARLIGSRSDYIARLLAGLLIYEFAEADDFFGLRIRADDIDFAVLTTAINYSAIAKYAGVAGSLREIEIGRLDKAAVKRLFQWMFERDADGRTTLGESRRIGDLNEVLGSAKARERLESGASLETSLTLTKDPLGIHRLAVSRATEQLGLARDQVHLIEGATPSDVANLDTAASLARSASASLADRIKEPTETGPAKKA